MGAAHLNTIRAARCQIKCAEFCKSEAGVKMRWRLAWRVDPVTALLRGELKSH